jgi:hypothetical protein
MLYLNQLEYRHIPYITHTKDDDVIDKVYNVARSGCGLCCVCMMIDALTVKHLPIEECVGLSEGCGANYGAGTDMSMLAPIVAERFDLDYRNTDEQAQMLACLQTGGHVIVHVKRLTDDEVGLFTKGGHYMSVISTDGEKVCILDPSYTPEKYHLPEREGKVNDKNAPFLYCHKDVLHAHTAWNKPKYHLFWRKAEG